ncbi:N-acetylmannosamine-6-phosphate 2-epimerase [Maritalea mediterranea]|uniref:Putative N-acetylmannosamine-6-phosphate 2-epimerase n=1 Tax=Maritalea mediterranea TaxID=2909667 RepID=A0ABS9E345_9HYPH|nr:putative N-acetylmannosamine-6-phosphate 2-epimerase [Maritalea mediterranea]MCF4097280.1 putative N-acetylmannosamine-6-phosphate 2-epimerase [Maritalea mediterranea]
MSILDQMRAGVVVSCQPVDHGPMDQPHIVAAMAQAVVAGGAKAVRIEGAENVRATRPHLTVPIIGIVKRDLSDSDVRITPFVDDVRDLASAGADIIAYDATDRPRPVATQTLVAEILAQGKMAMADCSTFEDGQRAAKEGALILGSTLSGYVGANPVSDQDQPDYKLLKRLKKLNLFIMAEGRYANPERVREGFAHGADAVTVGTALTRLEIMTSWFCAEAPNG